MLPLSMLCLVAAQCIQHHVLTSLVVLEDWPCEVELLFDISEIMQNNGHYTVQGHSRSPILVPIESPYTTSY